MKFSMIQFFTKNSASNEPQFGFDYRSFGKTKSEVSVHNIIII